MENKIENKRSLEPLHILLVGNNPIEMGGVLEKLNKVRGQRIITEIAFDLKSILERLIRFKPNFILIDDTAEQCSLDLVKCPTRNLDITMRAHY
jgi:hypothetical protein